MDIIDYLTLHLNTKQSSGTCIHYVDIYPLSVLFWYSFDTRVIFCD